MTSKWRLTTKNHVQKGEQSQNSVLQNGLMFIIFAKLLEVSDKQSLGRLAVTSLVAVASGVKDLAKRGNIPLPQEQQPFFIETDNIDFSSVTSQLQMKSFPKCRQFLVNFTRKQALCPTLRRMIAERERLAGLPGDFAV